MPLPILKKNAIGLAITLFLLLTLQGCTYFTPSNHNFKDTTYRDVDFRTPRPTTPWYEKDLGVKWEKLSPANWLHWQELNPTQWDFRDANYQFHRKYHFKIGNRWIIKPPYVFHTVELELIRSGTPSESLKQTGKSAWITALAANQRLATGAISISDAKTDTPRSSLQASLSQSSQITQAASPSKKLQASDEASGQSAKSSSGQASGGQASGGQASKRKALPPVIQRLKIHLKTGRCVMIDTDGKVYPFQIDKEIIDELRTFFSKRRWKIRDLEKDSHVGEALHYKLAVIAEDASHFEAFSWVAPSQQPQPALIETLVDLFNFAHRSAHPLSLHVNLLK